MTTLTNTSSLSSSRMTLHRTRLKPCTKKAHEAIGAEPDAKARKEFAGKTKRMKPCSRRRMKPSGPNPTPSLGRSLVARPRDGTKLSQLQHKDRVRLKKKSFLYANQSHD
ncbi:uncharacterized protein LOC105446327 isoform X3 [Strongylocentrotus purpuratus]|uniref:Uncharacterized protein n=1 Tax=Strongylocentrotus purpuratus TaxID=7668 RepID=A0A7M7T4W3_STRPU|nr:uncharacterized protein LOC105446327 isoform X3 [Strongylocentrotus purpuratus]